MEKISLSVKPKQLTNILSEIKCTDSKILFIQLQYKLDQLKIINMKKSSQPYNLNKQPFAKL